MYINLFLKFFYYLKTCYLLNSPYVCVYLTSFINIKMHVKIALVLVYIFYKICLCVLIPVIFFI